VAHVIRGRDRAPEMILVAQPIRAGKGQVDKGHVEGQGHRREHPAQRQGTTRNTRDRRLGQGHTTSRIGCGAATGQNTRCLKYPIASCPELDPVVQGLRAPACWPQRGKNRLTGRCIVRTMGWSFWRKTASSERKGTSYFVSAVTRA